MTSILTNLMKIYMIFSTIMLFSCSDSPSDSGTSKYPEFNLSAGESNYTIGSTYDFGSSTVGTTKDIEFTIQNTGSKDLILTGTPVISISGTDSSMFTVITEPGTTINSGSSTTFTIRFAPDTVKQASANIAIPNNDNDESGFYMTLTGESTTVPAPEIDVRVSGGSEQTNDYSYSPLVAGQSSDISFEIHNKGSADLTLDGNPVVSISGTDAAEFSTTQPASTTIAPGSSETITVSFSPVSSGDKTAAINISCNDGDESLYTLNLSGTATAAPEIDVTRPQSSFPNTPVGQNSNMTHTITNTGDLTLMLTGTPIVAITGTDASVFSVTTQPSSTSIAPSGSLTFVVTFSPTQVKLHSASLSIACDDSDENPFTMSLSGSSIAPEAELSMGETIFADGSVYDYVDTQTGSALDVSFTLTNTGGYSLTVDTPSIVGTNASEFGVIQNPSSTLAPGATTTITVRFAPLTAGEKSASLSFATSDQDENPYDLSLTGTAVEWTGTRTINSTGDIGSWVSLKAEGTSVYAAYHDATNGDLWFAKSANSGATWTSNAISLGNDKGRYASMEIDGNSIYISHLNASTSYSRMDFTYSTNAGAGFTGGVIDYALNTHLGSYSAIAKLPGSSIIWSVYYDDTNNKLLWAKSTDSGATWASKGEIATFGINGIGPVSMIPSESAHLSYVDMGTNDVKYLMSANGSVWNSYTVYNASASMKEYCSLYRVDTTRLFVAFCHNNAIGVAKSTDAGQTWGAPAMLNYSVGVSGGRIAMVGQGNYVAVVYFTGSEIEYRLSSDLGATWGEPVTIATIASCGGLSMAKTDGWGAVYVAYNDGDLKIRRSLNFGANW